jgi:YgiT-type zinc finger domain-containing protein
MSEITGTEEMRCYFCNGPVVAQNVTHVLRTPVGIVEFRDVPCEECLACGERYFSPEVVRRMEELAKLPAQEYVQIAAYDFV